MGIVLVGFILIPALSWWWQTLTPVPTQAAVGTVTIDQSVGGSSTLGIVTAQKLVDTASATYFIDPAATGDSLILAGAASASGTIAVGNTKTIRSAFGPLQLDYKSGLDAWTTGLTLQDTTGNVGIGTTAPADTLDIGGVAHRKATSSETAIQGSGGTFQTVVSMAFVGYGLILVRGAENGTVNQAIYLLSFVANATSLSVLQSDGGVLSGAAGATIGANSAQLDFQISGTALQARGKNVAAPASVKYSIIFFSS